MIPTDKLSDIKVYQVLNYFVESGYSHFFVNDESMTYEELENLAEACRLVGKKDYAISIEQHLEKL